MGPEELQLYIGRCIRAWRKKTGLTLAGLAESAGVDPGFLAYIETGKKMPSLVTLSKLAAALDLTIADLVKGVPPVVTPLKERVSRQVQAVCNGSRPEHLQDVIAVLKALQDPRKARALRQLLS